MRMSVLLLIVAITVSLAPSLTSGQAVDPSDGVFQVVIYDHEPASDGKFHGHWYGTGFFISADGIAVTNSHLVSIVTQHPQKYRLLAVVGKEFYDVTVICTSKLSYDAKQAMISHSSAQYQRDVAELKVIPSTAFEGRKDTLYRLLNKEPYPWATAHKDLLPPFAHLSIGIRLSSHVTIVGFGGISAIPYKWKTEATVDRTWTSNGIPLMSIVSSNPPEPGNSGSPVLNDQGEVIGLWTWYSLYGDRTRSEAQGYEVLQHPCP